MRSMLCVALVAGCSAFGMHGGPGMLSSRHTPTRAMSMRRPSLPHARLSLPHARLRPLNKGSSRSGIVATATTGSEEATEVASGRPLLAPEVGRVAWKDDFPQRNGREKTER